MYISIKVFEYETEKIEILDLIGYMKQTQQEACM